MPEMDGIALTKELLSLCPDPPVMIITGYGEEYLDAAIRAGAWDSIESLSPLTILSSDLAE
jgi:CheY-like chemotaxis protein